MRASWPIAVLGTACFTAAPPAGVPCDPLAPTCPGGQACLPGDTGFACLPEGTPPPIDAPLPDTPPSFTCGGDPELNVCFDFDAPSLSTPLANEGSAQVSADLVGVTRIAHGSGGAARLGATSTIVIPPTMAIAGVVEIEAAINLDAAIADGLRIGVVDTDDSSAGMSMFVYGGALTHQLRCNLDSADLYADLALVPGEWIDLRCSCTNNMVQASANGVLLGEQLGCGPGTADGSGMTIGQNNRGLIDPPDEPLIGAIDDVRLRTAP